MKKRLVTVNYTFKAVEVITESRLVSVMYEGQISDIDAEKTACEYVTGYFKDCFPDYEMMECKAKVPLTAYFQGASGRTDDGYSAEMSLDRIDQLIEETKPYTDRVVLNGWAPMETIEYFQGRPGHARYYVNTFEDPDNKDQYTVIKWSK